MRVRDWDKAHNLVSLFLAKMRIGIRKVNVLMFSLVARGRMLLEVAHRSQQTPGEPRTPNGNCTIRLKVNGLGVRVQSV